jgi:hypothetical protein
MSRTNELFQTCTVNGCVRGDRPSHPATVPSSNLTDVVGAEGNPSEAAGGIEAPYEICRGTQMLVVRAQGPTGLLSFQCMLRTGRVLMSQRCSRVTGLSAVR